MTDIEEWTKKYIPKTLSDVVSHKKAINDLIQWSSDLKDKIIKNIVVIYGKHGIGKTIISKLLAKKNNWDILELKDINDINTKYFSLLSNYKQTTFSINKNSFDNKICLVDNKNRLLLINVFESLNKNIERIILNYGNINKNSPIIIITDNLSYFSSFFIDKIILIKLSKIQQKSIEKYLLNIIKLENINIKKEIIEKISLNSNGNIKVAIQNLQNYILTSFINEIKLNEDEFLEKKNYFLIISKIKNIKKRDDIINLKKILIDKKFIFYWIYNNIKIDIENFNDLLKSLNIIIFSEKLFLKSNFLKNYWFDILFLKLMNINYHIINKKNKSITKKSEYYELLSSINPSYSLLKMKSIEDYFIRE